MIRFSSLPSTRSGCTAAVAALIATVTPATQELALALLGALQMGRWSAVAAGGREYECLSCHIQQRPVDGECIVINMGEGAFLCEGCSRLVAEIVRETDQARHIVAKAVQPSGYSAWLAGLGPLFDPRPLDEWHEDRGAALWWKFPVTEPPYAGTPLDDDFPDYVTHFTAIPEVHEPAGGAA